MGPWILAMLFACDDTPKPEAQDTDDSGSAAEDPITTPDSPSPLAEWAIYIFMNGDNDLESYVFYDLNELEEVGSSENVHVVVQADRSEDYWAGAGDWTDTRRYYITQDDNINQVTSELVMSVGEADMGSATDLADFLTWAYTEYPAEKVAVIFWNHGEAWSKGPPPPYISWDEGSGNVLSFAQGDVREGLRPLVDLHGPIELVGFDACYMGSWEVAHSLSYEALFMTGAETVVGMDGYLYPYVLNALNENPAMSTADVARVFAESAGSVNGEWTHGAYDLSKISELDTAMNQVSDAFIAHPEWAEDFRALRAASAAADGGYHDYFLDLGDFGVQLKGAARPELSEAGLAIEAALSEVILVNYNNSPFNGIQGLSIFADTSGQWSEGYSDGAGATWAQDTRWDDWIISQEP